ncbi:DUF1799 domain-containing protein [uncultured Gilvimarinus sp.]|uniref:DUF1799 domain-containing protein n=1 Tax=uncultured Gilvimarinus sp. TaxID=1689143 RepID=UPI0030D98808
MRQGDACGPEIQPSNEITVALFFKCSTQWVYAGMSGTRTGLNYPGVESRARIFPDYRDLSIELQDRVWDGLQRMELAALKQWQSKR